MPGFREFVSELKRRHVYRVAVVYGVVAWVMVQAASIVVPELMLPPWLTRAVIVLALLGLPLALEASNINFAPYIRGPKLMVNGREDEEHPWLTRALPLWNLLSEPKELALFDEAGHLPPLALRSPAIRDFLDRTLR